MDHPVLPHLPRGGVLIIALRGVASALMSESMRCAITCEVPPFSRAYTSPGSRTVREGAKVAGEIQDTVRARRIELFDEDGNMRIVLSAQRNGASGLIVRGAGEGALSVNVAIKEETGVAFVELGHPDGPDLFVGARPDGATRIQLTNVDGSQEIIEP